MPGSKALPHAIKYSPHGGTITVRLERRDEQVAVAVADKGIGIAPEDQERIFNRFYRIETVPGRPSPGLGLGLSLVKEIIGLHGGTVEVTSRQEEGSIFTVFLPSR
ncbi:MAG TPA: hypothetical protein DEP84_33310 [Chloroflexi bacterium]|nr:hypothetical protein [Chloroflexota bacterium]